VLPPDPIALAKAALRSAVKARRDALTPAVRAALSARINARLLELDSYRAAKTVLAYMSFGSEFDTRALIDHALAAGKTLVLPRVVRGSRAVALHVVTDLAHDLQPGVWGIPEPRADCPEISQVFDFKWILVPGLAFTPGGERLGYGAGFYDHLIARCTHQPLLVAAAFSTQVVDQIPCTAADQSVDLVVTEDATHLR
jgi:5-formyltetrahydrofolate cyclo-ligase